MSQDVSIPPEFFLDDATLVPEFFLDGEWLPMDDDRVRQMFRDHVEVLEKIRRYDEASAIKISSRFNMLTGINTRYKVLKNLAP